MTAGNRVTSTQIQLAGSRSFGESPGRIDVKKPNTPQNTNKKNRLPTGAAPRTVMTLVLSNVAVVTLIGLTVGIALAGATGRFVNTLLFGLVASDMTMVAVAAVTLGTAATLAGYVPARRAARVDPMVALRDQ